MIVRACARVAGSASDPSAICTWRSRPARRKGLVTAHADSPTATSAAYFRAMSSEERRARNEALFRQINERVKEIDDRMDMAAVGAPATDREEFVCECGDMGCMAPLLLTRDEYEQARSDPTYFLVLPERVDPEIERVVAKTERFSVVQKDPGERRIARETDPRSS